MSLDPASGLLLVLSAAGYLAGVRRLRGRGRDWPSLRTAAFVAAWSSLAIATQAWPAAHEGDSFTAHAVQHVLIGMVGPVLLALSAPVTLALQAAPRPWQRALLGVVHGRVVRALTQPLVAAALFAGSLFVLYLTPLFELSAENRLVHALVHAHFVLTGSAFFWPLVSPDPVRRRLPHPARMLLVFLTVPVHAVLGLALLSAGSPVAPDAYPDLGSQRTAAGVLWATGDLVGVAVTALVLVQWMRHDEREGAREDRRLAAARGSP
jgi:putative membrane protein